jgi:hypothetical protein
MKFGAFFVSLNHSEANFSSTVLVEGHSLPAVFRLVAPGLYTVHFTQQLDLRHNCQIHLKKGNEALTVLLPVLSKYNQRKLNKLSQLLQPGSPVSFTTTVRDLLAVEKYLEAGQLLPFFSLTMDQAIPELLRLEIDRVVKIVEFSNLALIPWDHCLELGHEMSDRLQESFERREKTIPVSKLERDLKIPADSPLFRYLLQLQQESMPVKLIQNAIVLQQMQISEEEKERMTDIVRILKKDHLAVFTMEDILKHGSHSFKQVSDAFWNMLNAGDITRISDRYFINSDELARIVNRLKKFKRNQGDLIDISSFRELTSLSRKHIIPLFEYLDAQKITQRQDNQRRILLPA